MNENKSSMMRMIQSAHFSLIETNLYLDTHPYDCEALKALEYYKEKYVAAVKAYEELYGAVTASAIGSVPFGWIKEPFPWELDC